MAAIDEECCEIMLFLRNGARNTIPLLDVLALESTGAEIETFLQIATAKQCPIWHVTSIVAQRSNRTLGCDTVVIDKK